MLWVRALTDSPVSRNCGYHYTVWLRRWKPLLVWVIGRLEKAQIWEITILLHFYMYILIMLAIQTIYPLPVILLRKWLICGEKKNIFDVSAKRGRGDLSHGIRNNHLFSTDCSWSQISINSIKCKLDFSWLVEVNVKILNKLQHTSTIYSDSVDLRQKWNSEIQSQRTQHQSPKTSLER